VCERLPLERFLYERSPLDKVALTRSGTGGYGLATALAAPLMEITAYSRHICDSVSNPLALILSLPKHAQDSSGQRFFQKVTK